MSAIALISTVNRRRIGRARVWLESRVQAEEVLIVGATLDAATELARKVAKKKGAAFGWHRLTLPQLAAAIAAPALATRGLVPLSRLGTEAVVARLVHRMRAEGALSQYDAVADTPGFPRAIAGVITELRMAKFPLTRRPTNSSRNAFLVPVQNTVTRRRRRSATKSGIKSNRPLAQRYSTVTF
jgi:hypothetical protein